MLAIGLWIDTDWIKVMPMHSKQHPMLLKPSNRTLHLRHSNRRLTSSRTKKGKSMNNSLIYQ